MYFKIANEIKLDRIMQQLLIYVCKNEFYKFSPYNDYVLLLGKIWT